MNPAEQNIADDLYGAIMDASRFSARSMQAREFKAGISDLGFCSERLRRMLDQQIPDDTDTLTAWIGTALGEHAEKAARNVWPHAIVQASVKVTLEGDRGVFTIDGHPDLVLPEGKVLDVKTDYGLTTIRRTGPNQQQQFQRHLYALGAYECGLFNDDVRLEDVQVGNIWLDRAGIDKGLHVQMEPFSTEVVQDAAMWLDNVVDAFIQEEAAMKEPPRDMCQVICGFFNTCRALDTDVEGKIEDTTALTAVDMYEEGLDLVREGNRLKDEAKQHLVGVTGMTGEFAVRWLHINPTVIPESVRAGHDRLDIRPIKRKTK